MKRIILLVAIIAMVALGGACGEETSTPVYTPTPTPTLIPTPTPDEQEPPAEVHTWLSPGKVQVGNFYPGARAEWPVTIHYGPTQTDYYTCVTGQQTTDFAVLSKPLYDGSLTYIYGWDEESESPPYYHPSIAPWWDVRTNPTILAIESDNGNDTLMVTDYDKATRTLHFSGLVPNTTRSLSITYCHSLPGQFEVYYKWVGSNTVSDDFEPAPIEAQDWVIVADPTPLMMPFETREIIVTVTMPSGVLVSTECWRAREKAVRLVNELGEENYIEWCNQQSDCSVEDWYKLRDASVVAERWEFQIGMVNRSIGGQVVVEMASRWMITMR